jgi:DnaJ-class molecular chaperone
MDNEQSGPEGANKIRTSKKCTDCYEYLKNEWGIDCGSDCNYEEAKKAMRKIMIKIHPDKNPNEKEKYTEIFQKVSDCNDRVIKDKCLKKTYNNLFYGNYGDDFFENEEPRREPKKKTKRKPMEEPMEEPRRKPSKKSRARKDSSKSKRKTQAQKRADCKAKGLVYDVKLDKCRPSKRGKSTRRSPSRKSRARKDSSKSKRKTQAQKRADCKAKGLVYDVKLDKCRPSKRGKSRRSPSRNSRARRTSRTSKPCPEGQVRSPSKRCIKIGGAAYKKYFRK